MKNKRLSGFLFFAIAAMFFIVAPMAQAATPKFTIAESGVPMGAAFDGTNCLVGLEGALVSTVKAQMISSTGDKVGSLIDTGHYGIGPSIAYDGTKYLMVWEEDSRENPPSYSNFSMYGQFRNTSGAAVGDPFAISTSGISFDGLNVLAYGGGKYLVTYTRLIDPDHGDDWDNKYIVGRIIDPNGTMGSEFRISTGYGARSTVTFGEGNFFVAWGEDSQDKEIRGRFVSPTGSLGTEISINNDIYFTDNPVAVAFDGTNYMVAWSAEVTTGNWNVFGHRVSPAGALEGPKITVASNSGGKLVTSAACDGINCLAVWTDMQNDTNGNGTCDEGEGTCWDVYGQFISKAGALMGDKFAISTDPGNELGFVGGYNNGKYLLLVGSGVVLGDGGCSQVGEAYGILLGGYGSGTHNASGTYTWDSGTLTLNTTVSDFICDGPELGPEVHTGVIVTSTTMTWPNDDMIWTRPSGTDGNIIGTWTATDPSTGNSYTITINSGDTFSLAAVIVACGDGDGGGIQAYSQHWDNGYYAHFYVDDPTHQYTAVSVSGPYVSTVATSYVCGAGNCVDLDYDAGRGSWSGWSNGSYISFGSTYPTDTPLTYTFELTDGTGTTSRTDDIEAFVEPFATGLAPTGTVSTNPVFAWTGPNFYTYGVELHDNLGNTIWSVYDLTTPSIAYPGVPALTEGMTYNYNIVVRDAYGNASFAQESFVYQTAATPLYVVWTDDTYGNNEIFLKKSTDNGATWTFQRLTNNSGNSQFPKVAVSGNNVYVVWQDDTYAAGVPEIFLKRSADSGATWQFQRLTTNTGSSFTPDVVASGNNVYVVWEDNTYGNAEIFLKKSTDNGATWTFQRLTNNTGVSMNPSIRVNGNNVYVVWQDDTYAAGVPEIFLKRSADSGATWQFQRLTNNIGNSQAPVVAVNGNEVYVVWQDDSNGNNEIFLKKSINGGNTWTFQRLTNNAGTSGRPSIALSSSNIYVVWEDDTYVAGVPEIFFKKSADGGNTWTFQRLTNNTGSSGRPSMALSSSNIYVVWEDNTYGNYEIFFKKSIDNGATWSFQRLTTNTGNSVMPAMAR